MREHRNLRVVSVLTITAALTFSVFASTALAATPAGWGATAVANPTKVSANDTAGFDLTFTNSGPSNIPQLYLVSTADGFVEATTDAGTCNPTGPLFCNIGAVNAGVTVHITVVYATTNVDKTVDFLFNTTGVARDPKGRSHGDALTKSATANVSTSNRDFAGRFIGTNGNQTVFDDPNLTKNNPHSTLLNAPEDFIPATVEEKLASAFTCPSGIEGFDPSTCFGQWSLVNANNGLVYTGGFSVLIGLSHFEIPHGKDETNINFVHLNDNGTFREDITDDCVFGNGDANPPTNIPCKVVTASGNDIFGLLWVDQNGPFRGH